MYSEIYCHGDLLHTVQMAKIFEDSKTFVDMKLKQKPEITLELYKDFMEKHDENPSTDEIRKFVNVRANGSSHFHVIHDFLLTIWL